jgi:hypothetical protein
MTKRDLTRCLAKWIPRLRLHDWDITLEYCKELTRTGYDDDTEELWGLCEYDIPAHSARISLLDLRAPGWKNQEFTYDPETVLVHELMHVVLIQFKIFENQPSVDIEEDVVNYFTKLLITMDRM